MKLFNPERVYFLTLQGIAVRLIRLLPVVLLFALAPLAAHGQEAATSLPPTVFTSTEFFFRRHITHKVQPEYPVEAQQAGIQGEVLVFVVTDEEGKVVEVKPLASPHESLSEAVVKAVKEWRTRRISQFDPQYLMQGELRFIFSLKDGVGDVSDAPEEVQRKESKEHYLERTRRLKKN